LLFIFERFLPLLAGFFNSYQLSVISYQKSVISYQVPAVSRCPKSIFSLVTVHCGWYCSLRLVLFTILKA